MPNHETTKVIRTSLEVLALNLEQHMHANGMTEVSLADATGLSKRTVGNFLRPANRKSVRGTSKSFPSGTIANLCKIADALDVEAWELLRGSRARAHTRAFIAMNSARARFHAAVEAAYEKRVKGGER